MNGLADFIVPAVSAIVGGVFSAGASYIAMRVELAVLRERIQALADSLSGMKEDIDGAHRRIDAMLSK